MTLREGRAVGGRRTWGPEHTPRLRLKPKAPATGHVDGAWWPHSDDLVKELPDLLAVLSVRLDAINRVVYRPPEWAAAPEKARIGGRDVRLDVTGPQSPDTLEVHGANHKKIVLLVIPHPMDPDIAHDTMMTAAAPKNTSTVDELLVISPQIRQARAHATATERRWCANS